MNFPEKSEKLAKSYYFQRSRNSFQEGLVDMTAKDFELLLENLHKQDMETQRKELNLSDPSNNFKATDAGARVLYNFDQDLQIEFLKRNRPDVARLYGISFDRKYKETNM